MEDFGLCPVCRKGRIVKGSIGYSCNYFKSMDDKCTFNIYHTYFDKVITDDIVRELLDKGISPIFSDLHKKDGKPFKASLKIEGNLVKPIFANEVMETPCPVCGGKVEELLSGYACENYSNHNCALFIPKTICDRTIPPQAVEILLKGQKTPLMDGFKRKDGQDFSSRLELTAELNVSFSNTLCKCPKCGGELYVGKKAYNCSNYKNETIKCDFVIWREISGRSISPDEAVELCMNKETGILSGFRDKEGNPLERKLIINEDCKVKMI